MRLRITVLLFAASTMVMVLGCQEPKEITPVAPPGFEYERKPVTQNEGAQAVGEQGAKAAAAKQNRPKTGGPFSPPTPLGKPTKTASGLVYETVREGQGEPVQAGQTVSMHYTGTLEDGKVFDSSRKPGRGPFSVEDIGYGRVIKGWNEGVPGMKVGERRKLIIPPDLGYGSQGAGSDIPPNATLIFDVELLEAK